MANEPKDEGGLLKKESHEPQEIRIEMGSDLDDVKPVLPTPPKTESITSASPAPQLPAEAPATPTAPPTPSMSRTTKGKVPPQLIGDLPRVDEEALKVFEEIPESHYQYGTLGRSREEFESTMCDCTFDPAHDDAEDACGKECINRMTLFECEPDECRLGKYCQNQRFRRRQHAKIEIVQTEKKGFGLRAGENIPKDTFVYEYVGDVVNEPSFRKRMREYAEQGIRHFYFMMLQKGEYIDATKRGGIGRFANHSCNPNCYVARWTVGKHVRMGIFSRRAVLKDEELTFNYNVDRYGHDAQICYCGEPNCIGFIGGKTQTDVGAMDELYLDALGITDEVETLGLKGSKKKRGRKLDEDYMPILKPLTERDVPKVVQATRQTQSRKVLLKLLTRIKLTEDIFALRQIMRLRGFSVMTRVMEDYAQDLEMCVLAMECMGTWPLLQRNKVEDSKVTVPVEACAKSDNETCKRLAEKLLAHWATLETAYRIPKRQKMDDDQDDENQPTIDLTIQQDTRPSKRSRVSSLFEAAEFVPEPVAEPVPVTDRDRKDDKQSRMPNIDLREAAEMRRNELAAILAEATAAAAAEAEKKAAEEAAAAAAAEKDRERRERRRQQASKKPLSAEEKEANKEKRLLKLVGAIVVKCMSKHQKQFDKDAFKKYAKELTNVIAEKEKKSSSYREGKLDALSDEKTTKIKKFAKEYIAKVIRKLEKSKHPSSSSHRHHHRHSHSPSKAGSTSAAPDADTPGKDWQDDGEDDNGDMHMSVEEAMGMDLEELPDGEGDDDADMDASAEDQTSPSVKTPDGDAMDITPAIKVVSQSESPHPNSGTGPQALGDPRRRKSEIMWDKAVENF